MEAFNESQALYEGISRTAVDGIDRVVMDSGKNIIWELEADTQVDDEFVDYPVIVHMRGALSSDGIALLVECDPA